MKVKTWRNGYGGGFWLAWLHRANTMMASYARSEKHNAFYVRADFAFKPDSTPPRGLREVANSRN